MTRDAYGLAVSTSSRSAADAYDRGVRALLGFGADTVERFREAIAADPEFVLARAALAVALYLDEQIPPPAPKSSGRPPTGRRWPPR